MKNVKITAWNADDKSDAITQIVENNGLTIEATLDALELEGWQNTDFEPTA